MPGRAADVPLQKLVQRLAQSASVDGTLGLGGAARILCALARTQAPGLRAAKLLPLFAQHSVKRRQAYLVHELLTGAWTPFCVTEVRADLRSIGLEPAGSAKLIENYDSLVLGKRGIAALAAMNRALCRCLGGPEEIRVLALPGGAAIQVEPGLLRRVDAGASLDGYPGWSDYLRAHGLTVA